MTSTSSIKWPRENAPAGFQDGMSLYEYVCGSALDKTDPTGLFGGKYHLEATEGVMKKRGYGADAIKCVVLGDLLVDAMGNGTLPFLPPGFWKQALLHMKATGAWIEKQKHRHFDNMPDVKAVINEWHDLEQDINDMVGYTATGKINLVTMLFVFGAVLHNVQDFYAHSNWAELCAENGFTPDTVPALNEALRKVGIRTGADLAQRSMPIRKAAPDAEKYWSMILKLKTGYYPDNENDLENSHTTMNKDSPKRVLFPLAYAAAVKETDEFFARLEATMVFMTTDHKKDGPDNRELLKAVKKIELTKAGRRNLESDLNDVIMAMKAAQAAIGGSLWD